MIGKKPAMNAPAFGSPAKKRLRSPVDAVEVADDEPGDVVEDVVKAGDDQQPVERAVSEQPEAARGDHRAAELVDRRFEIGEAEAEDDRADQPGDAGDDRDEAAAAEEGEIFRQLDVAEAVVEQARRHAREDAGRHAELGHLLGLPRGRGEVSRRLVGEGGGDVGRHAQQGLGALGDDEEADRSGKPRGAVVFAREADRDADREQHPEVGEDRVAGGGDEGDVEQVGLAEPKQHSGDRKHGDGQHQRPSERLQPLKLDHAFPP